MNKTKKPDKSGFKYFLTKNYAFLLSTSTAANSSDL